MIRPISEFIEGKPEPTKLAATGLLMLAPALAFALRYPLPGNADRLVDIGLLAAYSPAALLGYLAGILALFLLYRRGLRLCRLADPRAATRIVFAVGAALAAAFALMYPVNAIDLFIYAVRSRVFTAHAANPQAVPPAAFPDDPLMAFASAEWADDLSPYGPLWTLVAAPATALAGDDLGSALALYKLLAVAAVLAGGWLVFAVVRAEAPARAPAAALAYLWNPLVLWEGAGNGHNDALLAVPLLLALLAWVRRDDVLVPAWLAVGGALKYVSLPLLPLAVIAVWRRGGPGHGRARRLALGLASAAAVGMLSLAPFFDPSATLRSALAQGSIALTSPAWLAIVALRGVLPLEAARGGFRLLTSALFLAGLALLGRAVWRRPGLLPQASFELLALLLATATWNFRPWYLIWPLALAATLPSPWPLRRMVAWSAGALAAYAVLIWAVPLAGIDRQGASIAAVLVMFGPVALATALEARASRRVGRRDRDRSVRRRPPI
ncbi:MAG TPA: hypothetical protein VER37_10115 [Thermomicrobiales bacterium]|nr:hypothetical protein [Thermomicrobiales bacterium]